MTTPIEELRTSLKNAAVRLHKEGEPASSDFVAAVDALIAASTPVAAPSVPPAATSTTAQNLTELHEEIKWQGDEFNQIDSKVGITLGFVLIFAGQIFTLFTAKRSDLAPFLNALNNHPWAYLFLYGFIATIAVSLIFGILSRSPRDFRGSAILKSGQDEPTSALLDENEILSCLRVAVKTNQSTIKRKSDHSKKCHLFAAISLSGVVILIIASIVYQQLYAPQ